MFQEETLAKKLLTKGFWLYFFGVLIAPSGYFIKVIVSNDLSVADVGVIYSIIGLMTIITTYNDLGFGGALKYFLPKYREEGKYNQFKTSIYFSFLIQVVTSIVLGLLFYFGADFIANHYLQTDKAEGFLQLFTFYFIGLTFFKLLTSIFASFQDTLNQKSLAFIRMWAIFGFTLFFFLTNSGSFESYLYSWLWGVFIAVGIYAIIFFRKYSFALKKGELEFDKEEFKNYQTYAFWMLLGTQAGLILGQIDLQMIIYFLGPEQAGYYTNYQSMIKMHNMIITPLFGLLLPIVSQLVSKGLHWKLRLIQNIFYKYFTLLALSIGGFYLVTGDIISVILFGEKFLFSGVLLSIGGLFIVFKMLFAINFNIINALGHPKERVKIVGAVAILNIILNLILINTIGIIGAIIATVVGWMIMFFHSFNFINKNEKIKFDFKFFFLNLFYLVVFFGTLFLLKDSLFVFDNSYRYQNLFTIFTVGVVFLIYIGILNYKSLLILKNEILKVKKEIKNKG